jgi:outer membrane immunogenic protein
MKRLLIASSIGMALASGSAFAADMPVKAAPGFGGAAAPPVLFLWTGWYAGTNVGYSWGRSTATTNAFPGTTSAVTSTEGVRHRGWEASIEGGYCWQQRPSTNFVGCFEVRYDFPRERSRPTTLPPITPPLTTTTTTVTNTTHIDPLLIGPHLGFTTNANRTLWYGAGGLAIGEVGGSAISVDNLGGTSTANPASKWTAGWFVGAGMEQMLNNNWGLKVEYDYVRLETGGVTGQFSGTDGALNGTCPGALGRGGASCPGNATLASRPFDNVVTVGINYHFH